MTGLYEDIMNVPYDGSKRKQRMSMNDRAAQFSPFAPLNDDGSAGEETSSPEVFSSEGDYAYEKNT